jgi:hypothetical protein
VVCEHLIEDVRVELRGASSVAELEQPYETLRWIIAVWWLPVLIRQGHRANVECLIDGMHQTFCNDAADGDICIGSRRYFVAVCVQGKDQGLPPILIPPKRFELG